jgi:hypothetical protein
MKAVAELKFVLKLIGHEDYRAPISKLNPTDKTLTAARDKICRDLAEREIVDYSREISQFKAEPAGKAALKDGAQLPLSDYQMYVLNTCLEQTITPGAVAKIPPSERQAIIQDLEAKGLIKAMKVQIKEVWLTNRGCAYMKEEYSPTGGATISLTLLQNYLRFLRREMQIHSSLAQAKSTEISSESASSNSVATFADSPSDAEILQLIQTLDHELGTENYLPIFHLRQKLQSSLSRHALDEALYRLQRSDAIELSSLQEADAYTAEQIDAGIPQNIGGSLFFITVNSL